MIKIRNKKINEKDIVKIDKYFRPIMTTIYMFIFSVIFYFAQYGLSIFMLDAKIAGYAIICSIIIWMLYGFLCILLKESFSNYNDMESNE